MKKATLDALIRAGSMLSNIAYNLSQAGGGYALEDRHCRSMRECYIEWDAAIKSLIDENRVVAVRRKKLRDAKKATKRKGRR